MIATSDTSTKSEFYDCFHYLDFGCEVTFLLFCVHNYKYCLIKIAQLIDNQQNTPPNYLGGVFFTLLIMKY